MKNQRKILFGLIMLTTILFAVRLILWLTEDPYFIGPFIKMVYTNVLHLGILPLIGWILLKSNHNNA
jgi:hypothetical protein